MGSQSLLQQIFLTQELNWGFLHCRWILYQLSYEGNPEKVINEIINSWLPGGKRRRKEFGVDIYTLLSSSPVVKNLPANERDSGCIPGWEDPLEREVATHSSVLAVEILWTEEPGGLQSMGSQRVRHDLKTRKQQHV